MTGIERLANVSVVLQALHLLLEHIFLGLALQHAKHFFFRDLFLGFGQLAHQIQNRSS